MLLKNPTVPRTFFGDTGGSSSSSSSDSVYQTIYNSSDVNFLTSYKTRLQGQISEYQTLTIPAAQQQLALYQTMLARSPQDYNLQQAVKSTQSRINGYYMEIQSEQQIIGWIDAQLSRLAAQKTAVVSTPVAPAPTSGSQTTPAQSYVTDYQSGTGTASSTGSGAPVQTVTEVSSGAASGGGGATGSADSITTPVAPPPAAGSSIPWGLIATLGLALFSN